MIIIDFDDTLFDTDSFKKARFDALKNLGVSEELYWQTYQQAYQNVDGIFTYSDARHAKTLAELGFNENLIAGALGGVSKDLKKFLFADAEDFVKSLKELRQPMVLLSHGDPGFQELKVKGAGIDKYFDRIFMVEDSKERILKELLANVSDEVVWFVNDKVDETVDLAKKFPQLKCILKISRLFPETDYQKSGLPFFNKLDEIGKYLLKFKI